MSLTWDEYKKKKETERNAQASAVKVTAGTDPGGEAARRPLTYKEYMAKRDARLREEKERASMAPIEDAYREAGEQAKNEAEAARKNYVDAYNVSRMESLRRAVGLGGYSDKVKEGIPELSDAQKEYGAAKEKADFYKQYPTLAGYMTHLEEEAEAARKKATRFDEYTDEAGAAAWEFFKAEYIRLGPRAGRWCVLLADRLDEILSTRRRADCLPVEFLRRYSFKNNKYR